MPKCQLDKQTEQLAQRYADFYAVVRKIPRGKVVTYGQLAELAGRPGAARAAGAALRCVPQELGLPWQRVVGKKSSGCGAVRIVDSVGGSVQRELLQSEGVEFTESGGISLASYGWLPK